jgi:putative Ca2+/H+ antiporter (TMEM165/GDT1 family)
MLNLFAKTFALVFLAELGDKTQLAALTLAASTPGGKWAIFLGSALALALTSLIAVFVGDAIMRVAGSARVVKAASGILFLLIGLVTLVSALRQ